jgi:hypothetical protein
MTAMRKIMPLALLLLTGCADEWTRPGATQAEVESDMAQCQADADAKAPVNIAESAPDAAEAPITSPYSGFGNSIPSGIGAGYGGIIYQDANRQAREEIYDRCMVTRGYFRKP